MAEFQLIPTATYTDTYCYLLLPTSTDTIDNKDITGMLADCLAQWLSGLNECPTK